MSCAERVVGTFWRRASLATTLGAPTRRDKGRSTPAAGQPGTASAHPSRQAYGRRTAVTVAAVRGVEASHGS